MEKMRNGPYKYNPIATAIAAIATAVILLALYGFLPEGAGSVLTFVTAITFIATPRRTMIKNRPRPEIAGLLLATIIVFANAVTNAFPNPVGYAIAMALGVAGYFMFRAE